MTRFRLRRAPARDAIAIVVLMAHSAIPALADEPPRPRPRPVIGTIAPPEAEFRPKPPATIAVARVKDDVAVPVPSPKPGEAEPKEVEIPKALQPAFDLAAAKACEQDLAALGVRFTVLDPIDDGNGCGSPRPLEVSAVGDVALEPAATIRCPLAAAAAEWITRVVAPSAKLYFGDARLTTVRVAGSYECRHRVGGDAGKYSEHATANALDVGGFAIEGRADVPVAERSEVDGGALAFQAAVRGGACVLFTTVLGPATNPDHSNHLHLDLAERRGGYGLCE